MTAIEYVEGGEELLDRFAAMWERLNALHARICPDFSHLYAVRDFAWRKARWLSNCEGGLWACLALADGQPVGFLVCSIGASGEGEVATLYVEQTCRRTGVGTGLMERGMRWLKDRGAKDIGIDVVAGNDRAVAFYRTFGFKVRKTRMSL